MSVLNTGLAKTSTGGYEIGQSLRFDADDSAYLNKTWGSSPTDGNKFTFSVWVKRGDLDSGTTQFWLLGAKDSAESNIKFYGDKIEAHLTGSNYDFKTDAVFRDTSAWYHLVFTYDSDDGTVADRFKIYVNGVRQALGTTSTIPSGADNEFTKNGTGLHLGAHAWGTHHFDGYMAEVHLIDGTALTPTSFGETGNYGEWKPIEVSGLTYGNNGFYLDFADSGNLGDDVSGNGNDLTEKNIGASDQMLDTPTNNFATLNPLGKQSSSGLSEGNLKAVLTHGGNSARTPSTFAVSSGKWYWEVKQSSANRFGMGVFDTENYVMTDEDAGLDVYEWAWILDGGASSQGKKVNSAVSADYGAEAGDGDVIMVALDVDNNAIWFGKNDSWFNTDGSASSATVKTQIEAGTTTNAAFTNLTSNHLTPMFVRQTSTDTLIANFGQDSSFAGNKTAQGNADSRGKGDFYYTPPSGFLALCTSNLPNVAVKPSQHFNTVLYTANNSTNAITGVGFRPDFVWTKSRSNPYNHDLYDAVRGTGRRVQSNRDRVELTSPSNTIESFDSDGFTVGASDNGNSTGNSVSWNWKANGSGSANTNGSITSTVSANTVAGFSIVSWTSPGLSSGQSATVGHGLSTTPDMVIIKRRDSAGNWLVGTTDLSWNWFLYLNTTSGAGTSAGAWNNTAPTSSVFTIGSYDHVSSGTQVAYCFHSVDGYSKVGSYVGNTDTDGTFVYTGFRPKFILMKHTTGSYDWGIWDSARDTYNVAQTKLKANDLSADTTGTNQYIDFLSNGFKFRNNSVWDNGSGATYIYLAFAEQPFKYSNAR